MSSEDDAFGHALLDYMLGKEVDDIIERDDGLITKSGGPAVYFASYDDWSEIEQKAIKFARGRVLDIGCGAGRHALYLQDQGLEVLGIDISPKSVEVARKRGLHNALVCPVTQVSSKLGRFDTILMMGNNFGLLANYKRGRWLLRRFLGMTSSNARIIASSSNPHQTDKPYHLKYHEMNRQKGRMPGQVRIRFRYQTRKDEWFDYLLVSREEMEEMLLGTGWSIEQTIDSDGAQYIAILEKL
jgi:SAM-dependent methyltransferase